MCCFMNFAGILCEQFLLKVVKKYQVSPTLICHRQCVSRRPCTDSVTVGFGEQTELCIVLWCSMFEYLTAVGKYFFIQYTNMPKLFSYSCMCCFPGSIVYFLWFS
jgi:hypothetical protein